MDIRSEQLDRFSKIHGMLQTVFTEPARTISDIPGCIDWDQEVDVTFPSGLVVRYTDGGFWTRLSGPGWTILQRYASDGNLWLDHGRPSLYGLYRGVYFIQLGPQSIVRVETKSQNNVTFLKSVQISTAQEV